MSTLSLSSNLPILQDMFLKKKGKTVSRSGSGVHDQVPDLISNTEGWEKHVLL